MEEVKYKKSQLIALVIALLITISAFALLDFNVCGKTKTSRMTVTDDMQIFYPSEGDVYQKFVAPYDTIKGFKVDMHSESTTGSDAMLFLLNSDYSEVCSWYISPNQVQSDSSLDFPIPEGLISEGKTYYLYMVAEDDKCPIGITSYKGANFGFGSSVNNGYIWSYGIDYVPDSLVYFIIEAFVIVLILVLFLLIVHNVKEWIIASVVCGFLAVSFLLVMPFNTINDEHGHFFRSYEISQGHLLSDHWSETGVGISDIPDEYVVYIMNGLTPDLSVDNSLFTYKNQSLLKGVKESDVINTVLNANQCLYSPVSYIPQAIGIFVAKIFTKSIYWVYFFGRLFATIVNLLFVILALYMFKDRSRIVMAIVATPIFMVSMISYSADGTLNTFSLFFVAYIMWLCNRDELRRIDYAILIVSSVVIALSKVIYFPLVFMILIIPKEKFKSDKSKLFKVIVCLLALTAFIVWYLIAKTYLVPTTKTNPDEQMIYLLSHIYLFPIIIVRTAVSSLVLWVRSLFGGLLYNSQIYLNNIIWISFFVLTIFEMILLSEESTLIEELDKKKKIFVLGIILLIVGMTFASLYVQWTPYKSKTIDGIQGRYFIPLLLPIYLVTKKVRKAIPSEYITFFEAIIILIVDAVAMISIINIFV